MFQHKGRLDTSPSSKKYNTLASLYSLTGQEESKTPPPKPTLADLSRAAGGGNKDIKKVTIIGGGGGAGDAKVKTGPTHGLKHPLHKEEGDKTMVWDTVKRQWVPRGKLTALPPSKVVIQK